MILTSWPRIQLNHIPPITSRCHCLSDSRAEPKALRIARTYRLDLLSNFIRGDTCSQSCGGTVTVLTEAACCSKARVTSTLAHPQVADERPVHSDSHGPLDDDCPNMRHCAHVNKPARSEYWIYFEDLRAGSAERPIAVCRPRPPPPAPAARTRARPPARTSRDPI